MVALLQSCKARMTHGESFVEHMMVRIIGAFCCAKCTHGYILLRKMLQSSEGRMLPKENVWQSHHTNLLDLFLFRNLRGLIGEAQ